MSNNKLQFSVSKIEDFLGNNFNKHSKVIKEFTENEVSRAFLFAADGEEYVIRIDRKLSNFQRDKYAYKHFSTQRIIIPETIQLGRWKAAFFYSITRKLEGVIMDDLDRDSFKSALPDFASVIKAIHETNLRSTSGYGDWNPENGNGYHRTWKDFLLSLENSDYYNWVELFKRGIFEEDLYRKLYEKIRDLSISLPEDRRLIHGDLGFNNILIRNGKVSGVLDWGVSKYGDFVYDFAWLDFWGHKINYPTILKPRYSEEDLSNFDERLLCYLAHVSLTTMGFFALWEDRKGYEDAKKRTLRFL